MDIDQIIQEYIEPRIADECKRLGIPRSFIMYVYSEHLDLFEGARCTPVIKDGEKDGEIIGVKIKFDYREKRPRGARGSLFHEMKHADQYHKNKPQSELEAYVYMFKRGIEEDCKTIVNKLKRCIFLFKDKKSV